MRKEDLIAFARRDWQAIAALKRQRWTEQRPRLTPLEALQIGDELRRHVRSVQRGWPTEEARRNDLLVHLRVTESLRRVEPHRRR